MWRLAWALLELCGRKAVLQEAQRLPAAALLALRWADGCQAVALCQVGQQDYSHLSLYLVLFRSLSEVHHEKVKANFSRR